MYSSLLLAVALFCNSGESAQAGNALRVSIRPTYGRLGPTRPDAVYRPLAKAWFAFALEGLKLDDQNVAVVDIHMAMLDAAGRVHTNTKLDGQRVSAWGGGPVELDFTFGFAPAVPVGQYQLRITVVDKLANAEATGNLTFEIREPDFGLFDPTFALDSQNKEATGPYCFRGQTMFIGSAVGGAAVGGGAVKVRHTCQIIGEDGKVVFEVSQDHTNANGVQMEHGFWFRACRAGKYTLRLQAEDGIALKSSRLEIPLTIREP